MDRQDSNKVDTPTTREYISYTGIAGSSLTGCTRGLGGSTAQAHNSGAKVEEVLTITHWGDLVDFLQVEHGSDGTHATPVVTLTGTQTLTNKRITKRAGTVASFATPTINTDNIDIFTITALAEAITSFTTNLSGTPTIGQTLIIRILDNGTARAITWGASFASRGATLPTTTTLSKYTYVGLIWNSVTSTWDCVAAITEA